MKKIGLVIKASNPEAVKLGSEMARWALKTGGQVFVDSGIAPNIPDAIAVQPEDFPGSVEVLIVLGGDGTMIHAVRLLNGKKVPILGVNMGSLGFLTSITVKEVFPLLDRIMRDDFQTEERMLLSVAHTRQGETISRFKVLNDAVIKGDNARLIRLETRINQEYVNTYRADGLIIATPTGSTAYSLSANGPILYPTIHSIIVAPICPFNLTNRPVVIPDWMTVDVTVSPDQSNVELILDGQVDVPLLTGDTVKIKRAEASVYLIKYEGKSYFDILRERLMWEVKRP
ncbi:MAG: NAD(+)/NADH kinase [Deltaproteobacteria bacterium]|nr:NAD(+)/NADH kinase [Deltaproteobacteria bacterium]